jgi:hypothetical protein
MSSPSRPISVILIGVSLILTGLIFLLGGTALLTIASGGSALLQEFGMTHIPIGASFIILGILSIITSNRWVWSFGLILVGISIVDDLMAFAFVPLPFDGIVGTAVVLVTATISSFGLVRTDVKSFFVNRASNNQ